MKILGLNVSVSREPVQKSGTEYPLSAAVWGDDWPAMGPVLRDAYQQVVWVYRAINVLAEQVANIPFRFSLENSGGDDVITSGPLLEFYGRPHAHVNRFQ